MRNGVAPPTKILLVEDNPGDQELTRQAFEASHLDSELWIVADGDEALEFLDHRGRYADPATAPSPDLILLDINLPRLNGFEVLAKIRAHPRLRTIPVIVLSTSDQHGDLVRAYANGASSYLAKPASMTEFFQLIDVFERYWLECVQLPSRR